jgi:hypothetical protein
MASQIQTILKENGMKSDLVRMHLFVPCEGDKCKFKCAICTNVITTNHGMSNLLQHLNTKDHVNWLALLKSRVKNCTNGPLDYFVNPTDVSEKAKNYYLWLEHGVMSDMPFSFVEDEYVRKNSRLSPISRNTYMALFRGVGRKVEVLKKQRIQPTWKSEN